MKLSSLTWNFMLLYFKMLFIFRYKKYLIYNQHRGFTMHVRSTMYYLTSYTSIDILEATDHCQVGPKQAVPFIHIIHIIISRMS